MRNSSKALISENKCEFYPLPGEGCVCYGGSDVSGEFTCTEEYSKSCQWAEEVRDNGKI